MVFDFTSTQQDYHDFTHPELTKRSISIELKFATALPNNIEIFVIGEMLAQFLLTVPEDFPKTIF